jgi:hypothetical protein
MAALALAGFAIGGAFLDLLLSGLRARPQNRRGLAFGAVFMCAGVVNTTTDMRGLPALYVGGAVPNLVMASASLAAAVALMALRGRALDVRLVRITAGELGGVRQIVAIGLLAAASFALLYTALSPQESIMYPDAVTRIARSELIRYIELPIHLVVGLVVDRWGRLSMALAALVGALVAAAALLAPDLAAVTSL